MHAGGRCTSSRGTPFALLPSFSASHHRILRNHHWDCQSHDLQDLAHLLTLQRLREHLGLIVVFTGNCETTNSNRRTSRSDVCSAVSCGCCNFRMQHTCVHVSPWSIPSGGGLRLHIVNCGRVVSCICDVTFCGRESCTCGGECSIGGCCGCGQCSGDQLSIIVRLPNTWATDLEKLTIEDSTRRASLDSSRIEGTTRGASLSSFWSQIP